MTSPAPVPVAVVGAGNMGRYHARNYDDMAEAELRAVVDAHPERAELVSRVYGGRPFTTLEEMLAADPEIAAATVATPTNLHCETATALLEAGLHVLVEKPIAATVEEADRLIELAAERDLVLAVGHVERFNPAVVELKRRIGRGDMGSVLSLIARRVGVMPPQVKDANVIIDLAIHDIDIFRYLLDADWPQELYCNAGKAIAVDRYDFADIFLRFGSIACFLQVNWLTPVKIRSLSVTGTKGYAELRYVTQELDYYTAQPPQEIESFAEFETYSDPEPERIEFEHGEPLRRQLLEFLKAVRGEQASVVTGEEGKRSMEVATAIEEAAGGR